MTAEDDPDLTPLMNEAIRLRREVASLTKERDQLVKQGEGKGWKRLRLTAWENKALEAEARVESLTQEHDALKRHTDFLRRELAAEIARAESLETALREIRGEIANLGKTDWITRETLRIDEIAREALQEGK